MGIGERPDELDCLDPSLFVEGARLVQPEGAWGQPVDTAAGVRALSLVALARIGREDTLLHLAEGLADGIASVRQAAAQAVGWYGHREGAALVLLRLRLGDEEPEVLSACMLALLGVAPEDGIAIVERLLRGDDRELANLAALALGESNRPEAVAPLAQRLACAITAEQRRIFLTALAMHRSDAARAVLLGVVREGPLAGARQAIAALGVQRFHSSVRGLVEAAAAGRKEALAREIEEAFGEPS